MIYHGQASTQPENFFNWLVNCLASTWPEKCRVGKCIDCSIGIRLLWKKIDGSAAILSYSFLAKVFSFSSKVWFLF